CSSGQSWSPGARRLDSRSVRPIFLIMKGFCPRFDPGGLFELAMRRSAMAGGTRRCPLTADSPGTTWRIAPSWGPDPWLRGSTHHDGIIHHIDAGAASGVRASPATLSTLAPAAIRQGSVDDWDGRIHSPGQYGECGALGRAVARRGAAWRGVAWRGVAWRGVARRGVARRARAGG